MQTEFVPSHGVMESGGAYNLHARVQARGASQALPLLQSSLQKLELNGDQPITIADYGSSQGKNSLAPMRLATEMLRARLGPDRPIFVVHVDQPANDFNALFDVLHQDPDSYARNGPNIFPAAIGRSFYEQVFPDDSVHLGWSSYAAMWLSRIPARVSGHFRADQGTEEERAAFRQQAAEDWKSFLMLRARELRPGARLVIVLAARNDEGFSGLEGLMDEANAELADMVSEGAIRAEERARMVLGSWLRRRSDLLAPFADDGRFHRLAVECCDLSPVADPLWADYEVDRDRAALAAKRARLFRSNFAPSLASALKHAGNGASHAFADRLEKGLERRLLNHAAPARPLVQTMVVVKE
jgi:SAM dependent carboxyl methyltransferase